MRIVPPTVADANGVILHASRGGGKGFVLLPAVLGPDCTQPGYSANVVPGSFPVEVRLPNGNVLLVTGSHQVRSDFESFDLLGMRPNDSWQVVVLEDDHEEFKPSGRTRSVPVTLQANGTDVASADPVNPSQGFAIRPGYVELDFHFAGFGAGETVELWVLTPAGNWKQTGDVITPVVDGPTVTRAVDIKGSRLFLRASVAGKTVEVVGEVEVG